MLLCLLVVCLVSNFNEHRSQNVSSNLLQTDLDNILLENKENLMNALKDAKGDLKIGIHDLNNEYLELVDKGPDNAGLRKQIVLTNGLVPFVAKNLPYNKTQEETLYELCLKYTNVNIKKQCKCETQEQSLKRSDLIDSNMVRTKRLSNYLQNESEQLETNKINFNELPCLSENKSYNDLDNYEDGEIKIEGVVIDEDVIITDTEDKQSKMIAPYNSKSIVEFNTDSLKDQNFGNVKEIQNSKNFSPQKNSDILNFRNFETRNSKIVEEEVQAKNHKEFANLIRKINQRNDVIYECHVRKQKIQEIPGMFHLVVKENDFERLRNRGTYSPGHFHQF